MKLYSFFRSGTSHRLRIALNLKGIATDYVAVDLRVEEHLKAAFQAVNPQGLVPALDTGEQVLIHVDLPGRARIERKLQLKAASGRPPR